MTFQTMARATSTRFLISMGRCTSAALVKSSEGLTPQCIFTMKALSRTSVSANKITLSLDNAHQKTRKKLRATFDTDKAI